MANYPYRFLCDHVNLVYNAERRVYGVEWRKIVENVADEPLRCIFGRINVCVFPDDQPLARLHYRKNPIDLRSLNFQAYESCGDDLAVSVIHEHDSNIELNILFQKASKGLIFALQPGEQKEVHYCIDISDRHWGPWLERHCRVPTDELSVNLSFPSNLVTIGGEIRHGNGIVQSLVPSVTKQSKSDRGLASYSWNLSSPRLQSRYRFHWLR